MSGKFNFINTKPKGEDLFEGKSQERTSEVICKILKDNTFQVIGIDGGWGVGKSNLVQIVDNKLKDHSFFIYDVWGHQEDEQRRSLLVELTDFITDTKQNLVKNKSAWDKKLITLLSKRREVTTENMPYLSIGFIFSLIAIIYTPLVLEFKSEITDWLNIESTIWKLVLLTLPILPIFGIYVWNFGQCLISGSGFGKSIKLAAQKTFQVYNDKQIKETTIESISEEEPTVKDFQGWMSDIDKDLNNKKLVLVLDNFDRLPHQHILNVWSSVHVFFAEKKYKNIKVIIPFDRKHIKSAFNGLNTGSDENFANDYINKTFDIVFRVSPPILSSWKDFFKQNWETAFENYDEDEFEKVEQVYEVLRPTITPREILAFINDFVTIKLLDSTIPDCYIAIFIIKREEILANPLEAIIKIDYLSGLKPLYEDDDDFSKFITALSFQIDPSNALEVIYKKQLRNCLINNKIDEFIDVSKTNVFPSILNSVVSELDDFRNPILVLDELNKVENISSKKVKLIWHTVLSKIKGASYNSLKLEEYQLVLLSNLTNGHQKKWLQIVLDKLWKDDSDFDIVGYVKNIDELNSFCNNNKIDLNPIETLFERTINIDLYKKLIEFKKEDYNKYKLACSLDIIDNYLSELPMQDLDNNASFIQYLSKVSSLTKFRDHLDELWTENSTDKDYLYVILKFLKLTSDKKIEFSQDLTDPEIFTLMNESSIEEPVYADLAAMRLSLQGASNASYQGVYNIALNSVDDEFIENVANEIFWYIDFDDLLVKSLSLSNSLMKGVVKKVLLLNPSHSSFRIEKILENLISISEINDVGVEDVLSAIKDYNIDDIKIDTLVELDTTIIKALFESQTLVGNKVIEAIKKYYSGRSKEEWEETFSDINSPIFEDLEAIDFTGWNAFALEEFKAMLLKIVIDPTVENQEKATWLIDSFKKSGKSLSNTFISVRNKLILGDSITPDKFNLLIGSLFEYGNLVQKADDVIRAIFNPELLDNDSCVKKMELHQSEIKLLLDKCSKSSKSDFREGLNARASNEDVLSLANNIGFRIKDN